MSDTLRTDITFDDLGLRDDVLAGIKSYGFKHPTDIQAELIPVALKGTDVIGQAKTGTGKTAAFTLPILHNADPEIKGQALILAPTRELANQIAKEIQDLAQGTNIGVTSIIGGESMRDQKDSMDKGGHIMVGTPGRVMDLHGRGMINFANIRYVVLDEVDRMLDIGFRDDIKKILSKMRGSHQTIFVSATMDKEIESLARAFMHEDAEKITTVGAALTVSMVDQLHLPVERWDKKQLLLHLLTHEEPATTVVFCRTKMTVKKVTQYLKQKGLNAREIHGDLHQSKRNRVMQQMRDNKLDILVASDLAARGLDVEHITHVINYDLPEDPEVYVHRIGRTARAGRRGVAWSFVSPDQGQMLSDIEKLVGVLIEQKDYPDFKPGPVPKDIQEERDGLKKVMEGKSTTADRVVKPDHDESGMSEAELKAMFPDGKIPKSMPKRGIGAKFRRRGR
ncbi:MAG: DEAD/DEAH box helicase [Phycisphaeraceae bacterium]|jgi:ATP-dependent RNA helicase DeaD